MIILRNKTFSDLHDSIKSGVRDWLAEKDPRLKKIIEREEQDESARQEKSRRSEKGRPIEFKAPEIEFVSPYDPPRQYQNWHGEAKKYYEGNTYYEPREED